MTTAARPHGTVSAGGRDRGIAALAAGLGGLLAFLGSLAGPGPALGQTVVVLMFDGWSPAMIEVEPTPALDAMRREGAWTHALEPAFPTISLPNQVSLSTGCWPERHGIVSNLFIDPARGEYDHATDPDWLLACEHLHQVAERQGVRTAALWWIGSHSARDGPLATYVTDPHEDPASPEDAERGRRVVELLRLPASERPRLILAYFTGPDMTAHYEGIGSPKTGARIRESDAVVGAVLDELRRLRADGDRVALFVTTDHGMLEVQAIVNVERILRRHGVRARFTSAGTTSFLYFESEAERDRALAALSEYTQFDVYRRDTLPSSWHLGTSPRIGDLTISAHPPFFIENIGEWPWWARWLGRWGPEFIKARTVLKATHGYPADVPGMRGFLYAWGDGIARGGTDGLRAVDLHPAVAALLGVDPGSPVDGLVPDFVAPTGGGLADPPRRFGATRSGHRGSPQRRPPAGAQAGVPPASPPSAVPPPPPAASSSSPSKRSWTRSASLAKVVPSAFIDTQPP